MTNESTKSVQTALCSEIQVWLDGRPVAAADARVSVFDRGFLYGDSVFETLRTYDRRPFALGEHMDRLVESARKVWIELPVPLAQLSDEVKRAVMQSPHPESYVRVMVTRGIGALGLDPRAAVSPLRVILVGPLSPPPARSYQEGIAVVSYQALRKSDATEAAGAKIGNYLVAVLANRHASERGAQEALIATSEGRVVEGATSNVFWFQGSSLCTPGLEAGILPGITRAHILRVAKDHGIDVAYRVPTIADLQNADEVFISSSIREMVPVVKVDEQAIGDGRPGPRTLALLQAFRDHCLRHLA